jgi:hypothetical protein
MSDIGLPAKMTKAEAYIAGMADGIDEVMKEIKIMVDLHGSCDPSDFCNVIFELKTLVKKYE